MEGSATNGVARLVPKILQRVRIEFIPAFELGKSVSVNTFTLNMLAEACGVEPATGLLVIRRLINK